ncbi:DUF485 domain-containing protein [Microterricola pindariensis]|uniref:DUF485 domain-containing protein n=1 Tax=Microterricola pindariensis TaxID=478010 RepID=A0ABX5AUD1_9MICO|nr:hypothetical protein GY24_11065 [Microterricola pindariensis]
MRVTAPGSRAAPGTGPAGIRGDPAAGSGADAPSQVAEVYVRSLIRSQLRLALVVAFGFLVSLAAFALVLRLTPELEAERWFGVPVAWLLLAFGVYPMIGLSAWLYVWAAGRNEARYTALAEEGP